MQLLRSHPSLLVAERKAFYKVFLAQAVGMGFGIGFLFGPYLACTGADFKMRRPFAIEMCTTGGGFEVVHFVSLQTTCITALLVSSGQCKSRLFVKLFVYDNYYRHTVRRRPGIHRQYLILFVQFLYRRVRAL